jgi:YHS domain-containing protein
MLQMMGRSLWFKDLNSPELIPALFDYIEAIIGAGRIIPPQPVLEEHLYERFVSSSPAQSDTFGSASVRALTEEELERLDPVCWMEVDPATAKHWVDYEGRRVYFCAPSCKRLFTRNPGVYLPS